MTGRPDLNLGNFLPYLINRAGAAMVAQFTAQALDRHRLSIAMWRVLLVLANAGEQRQVGLVGLTSIDASTLSRIVTRLVRMGLVTRARSQTSNREVVVQLSAKGAALVESVIPIARELERRAGAGLPAKDMAMVKRSLRRIYQNIVDGRPAV